MQDYVARDETGTEESLATPELRLIPSDDRTD
jgi:hypothetical protein